MSTAVLILEWPGSFWASFELPVCALANVVADWPLFNQVVILHEREYIPQQLDEVLHSLEDNLDLDHSSGKLAFMPGGCPCLSQRLYPVSSTSGGRTRISLQRAAQAGTEGQHSEATPATLRGNRKVIVSPVPGNRRYKMGLRYLDCKAQRLDQWG